jgi:glycosyltransferase involved in cell wall biosynthesis
MPAFSIVIITKNEAAILAEMLNSLAGLSNDVVVADNGSTDDTVAIARQYGASVEIVEWQGFGPTKNEAVRRAANDWVLALDADEIVDASLYQSLKQLELTQTNMVYAIERRHYVGNKMLRFGEMRPDHPERLFNRTFTRWNDAPVHEKVVLPEGANVQRLCGFLHHKSMRNQHDYLRKSLRYAEMMGRRYFEEGKQVNSLKLFFYPAWVFVHAFIFKGGFLDGAAGLNSARVSAMYARRKYTCLRDLVKGSR